MINPKLLNPGSIAVIGGSDDITKAGGKVLKNIKESGFSGPVYVVNPKASRVQGLESFSDAGSLPQTDMAVIAVPARFCPDIVRTMVNSKGTGGFIILSAGFSEEGQEGAALEREIVEIVNSAGATLIGPNCIGFLNTVYHGVFTTPIPSLSGNGVDFISGSGATAVFIIEKAITSGLHFSSVWSVGNSAQTGVEDVLEHLDQTFDPSVSSRVKLLYIENISDPGRFLKHSRSLVRKGCRIAAIKAGTSEAGTRAASSHTGAMASPDTAIEALFRKAGIVRCYDRTELTTVASLFTFKPLPGRRIAVITHAGGPAVMLTDALSEGGLEVPHLTGAAADRLLEKLYPGSSVANPVDFLATGTASQLESIIDACENDFDNIDGMVVIFGSPGLFPVDDVYDLIDRKIRSCRKPVYPVMPSVINVSREMDLFVARGNAVFTDEVLLGRAMCRVFNTVMPEEAWVTGRGKAESIRAVVDRSEAGYLSPEMVRRLLVAAGINTVEEEIASTAEEAVTIATRIGYPLVMKVVGPLHKSDVGGVVLNVSDAKTVTEEFKRMIMMKEVNAVILQKMVTGTELFCGAKREGKFGHLIMAGMGGIYVEIFRDVAKSLAPVGKKEALEMIRSLQSYPLFMGARGRTPIGVEAFADIIVALSDLVMAAPEIEEMDINPLIAYGTEIKAVDARIRISK